MKHLVAERFWCIKQMDIFRDFAEADADALAQITAFKRFKIGEPLRAEGVYLLKEGRVKIYETPADDAEPITLEVLEPGEMFGAGTWEEDDGLPSVTAETITEAVIGIVSARNFLFFLKRKPHLAMPMQNQFNRFTQKLIQAAQRFVRQKTRVGERGTETGLRLVARGLGLCRDETRLRLVARGPVPRRPAITNKLSNITFRSPASRLALILQTNAMPPLPDGTVWTCKFSIKTFARLIGSSEEKIEELLEQFQQHHLIKNDSDASKYWIRGGLKRLRIHGCAPFREHQRTLPHDTMTPKT